MKAFLFYTFFLLLSVGKVTAQSVTFYRDPGMRYQFLLTEGFGGDFKPFLWYQTFHSSYKSTALGTGKMIFRSDMFQAVNKEIEHAIVVDSMLVERSKIEALNMAERQTTIGDLAWIAEGPEVNRHLGDYTDLINKIILSGGTEEDKDYYELQLNTIKCGIEILRESYLPMSHRKLGYEMIIKDLKERKVVLSEFLYNLECKKRASYFKERRKQRQCDLANIITVAQGRWKMALKGRTTDSESAPSGGISAD